MSKKSEIFSTENELRRALDAHIAASVDAALEQWLAGSNSVDPTTRAVVACSPVMPSLDRLDREDRDAHAPEPKRLYVYVAGSRGAARLAHVRGEKVFKIGTTHQSVDGRLKEIGKDKYGAAVRRDGKIVVEDGFDAWVAQMIHATRTPADPAVSLSPRAIAIDLPPSLTTRRFDRALHAALLSRALATDPRVGCHRRLTIYSIGSTNRVSAADEFYRFDPCADANMLVDAVETVLRRNREGRG